MADMTKTGQHDGSTTPAPDSEERLRQLRRCLALSRGGKVQFIVDPAVTFANSALRSGRLSDIDLAENTIRLNPTGADPALVQHLARRCFEANVHRYTNRFRTLRLIEKVPGVRGLWARIIETMTDAVIDDLVALGHAGFESLTRFRPRLDRDATSADTIQEILEVVNHGIDGYTRRQVERDPQFRQRVMAIIDPAEW